jgi:hypothetical protein
VSQELTPWLIPSAGLFVGWRPLDSKVAFISSSASAKSLNKYFPGVEEQLSSQP